MDNNISKLVLDNDKLVHYFVRKISKGEYEYDDLLQVGRIGLIKAAKTYNGKTMFTTYASRCITNEFFMYFRKNNKHINGKVSLEECVCVDSEGYEVTYSMIIEDKKSNFYSDIENREIIEKALNIALNALTLKEKLVWLYVIAGKTQKYIAKKLNITQSYVSRIYSTAYKKVRTMYEKNIKYMEVYHMKVNANGCSISFCVNDTEDVNKVIVELLKSMKNGSKINITRRGKKVSIHFPIIEECFESIAYLIEAVNKYSIDLLNYSSEYGVDAKEEFDEMFKSGTKEYEIIHSNKIENLCNQIVQYARPFMYFHELQLYTAFKRYKIVDIKEAINLAIKKGKLKCSEIQGYYMACEKDKSDSRFVYSVPGYTILP